MTKLLRYLKKSEWYMVLASVVFVMAQVWLDLKLPDYMARITTLVQTPGSAIGDVWAAGGKMLLCALGSVATSVVVGYFASRVAAGFSRRLRRVLFDRVEDFSMEELNKFSTASLITRSTNDITQVQLVVALGLQVMIKAPITAVWAIVKISGKSWQWTTSTAVAVAVMMAAIGLIVFLAMPKFKRMQRLTDNLNRVTRENLTGLRVVRAYNAEGFQQAKFGEANDELMKTQLFTMRTMAVMGPMMSAIMSGLTLAVYWIGASLINSAAIPGRIALFSDMVVFSSYAMQVVMSFAMLTMIFILLPRAQVSAKRIDEVLSTEAKIKDGTKTEGAPGIKGVVEFRNVGFKYPDASEYVLKDVSFTANRGETVAFIGSTGSGKSTLINLVPRFYDATEGSVLIDGVDVKDYTQSALRSKLGYVPQRAVLFSGTVTSNVSYGDRDGQETAAAEDVKRAVEIAQGTDFVEKMEGAYDAEIAQGGTNVSGGQKQRLAIARAVCRKPEIYIFDDSFSALDYKTDRALRSVLKRETADTTSLIVAQRIGTIRDADRIVVLDNGTVSGIGTHDELMKSCRVYREIAYSQLSEEELA